MRNRIPGDAYAIIIGAMKCGTSSLYSYLKGHPQICPAVTKEPEYFSEHQGHGLETENYEDLWSFDDSVHKYALEASTGYTKYPYEPNVPANIRAYGISPRFIYIVRNPLDAITSHYNYMQRDESWKSDIIDKHIITICNFYLQLEQYRNLFPAEDILVLDFDELRDNPRQLLQRVYRFLDISHDYIPAEYEVRNATQIDAGLLKILRRLKIGAIAGYMPEPMVRLGENLLGKAFPVRKRTLTDQEKDFVHDQLKDDMARLHQVYGVDVGKWGFDI